MTDNELGEYLATRRSLITRLKNWDDHEGWRQFFQTYWKLIYSVAIKSGLTDSEAEDVVQETVVTVARTMAGYRYEPGKCRFKTWLMRIARMRIVDQFRKREPGFTAHRRSRHSPPTDTATEERVPDPAPFAETLWDEEWRKNLIDAAMDRVKRRVKPEHYQIFYLGVVKELGARHVARTLGVGTAQVYLVKHRVAAQVKREIQRLEKGMHAK
jgi:RNA polymerase sigma factor (sigma-70 family)